MPTIDYQRDADDDAAGLIEDLRNRLEDAVGELDDRIAEHPFAAVGIAFGLGALFALSPRLPDPDKRTIRGLLASGLTALALRGVKSYAWSRLSGAAKGLFDGSSRERQASRDRSVEAFLEH